MFKLFQRHSPQYDLFMSARRGDLKLARKSLDTGLLIDTLDGAGRTALCVAAKHGQPNIIRYLVERGADVNFILKDGRTALFHAIHSGDYDAIVALVQCGARLDVQDTAGYTPYSYAAEKSMT